MNCISTASIAFSAAAIVPCAIFAEEMFGLAISTGFPMTFVWGANLQDKFVPDTDKYLAEAGGEFKINWTEANDGQLGGLPKHGGLTPAGEVEFGNAVLPFESVACIAPFDSSLIELAATPAHALLNMVPELNQAGTERESKFLNAVSLGTCYRIFKVPVTTTAFIQ